MQTRSILAAAGVLAFACAVQPVRADDAAVRKQLDAQYAKLIAAFKKKDVKGIISLGTSDFTMKEHGQVSNAQQSEQALTQMFAMMKSMDKVDMKIQKLQVKGNTAVATASYTFDGKVADPQTGKTHRMVSKGLDKDTWVKSGNTWKIKSVETIKDETTMDGQKFNPAAMATPAAAPKKK